MLSNKDKIENIYEISFPGAQKISLPDCRTVQTCFGQIIEIRCSRGILKTRLNFDTADNWLEQAFIYFKSQTESMSMSVLNHQPWAVSDMKNIYTRMQNSVGFDEKYHEANNRIAIKS